MATFFKPTKKATLQNQILTLTIERLDPNGLGIARYQKKSVFVEYALPGEVIKAKVVEQNSKFIKATLVSIVTASPERIEPVCQHFYQCGGCDLQHLVIQAQLDFKQKKVTQLFSREGIKESLPWQPTIESDATHYRRKARIGVQYNKHGDPIVGFRKKGSNQLITIKNCHVLDSVFEGIFITLNRLLQQLSAKKSIGHVEVIQANRTCIVIRQLVKMPSEDKQLWLDAQAQYQWQIVIDNGDTMSPLLSDTFTESLSYSLFENTSSDTTIYFSPSDFIQVNHRVNQQMVTQAIDWLDLSVNDTVLDLFCGLGNFSLPIAKQVSNVVGVEGVQNMVDKASNNARLNQVTNCEFFQADLNSQWGNDEQHVWSKKHFSKVVLDPARAGAKEATEQLVHFNANKIVYISCEASTLARDAAILINQGYRIKKIALMDMFSQTKHIETMVLFEPK